MSAAIPAPGTIAVVEYAFNVLHDVAVLNPRGETVFFRDFRHFWDGRSKRYPEECNLGGEGNCLPVGMQKKVIGVSVQVLGAHDDDVFKVDLVLSKQLAKTLVVYDGIMKAARIIPGLLLVGLEWFEVHVRAPERLRSERAYARVTLHGPLSIAVTVGDVATDAKVVDAVSVTPAAPTITPPSS